MQIYYKLFKLVYKYIILYKSNMMSICLSVCSGQVLSFSVGLSIGPWKVLKLFWGRKKQPLEKITPLRKILPLKLKLNEVGSMTPLPLLKCFYRILRGVAAMALKRDKIRQIDLCYKSIKIKKSKASHYCQLSILELSYRF